MHDLPYSTNEPLILQNSPCSNSYLNRSRLCGVTPSCDSSQGLSYQPGSKPSNFEFEIRADQCAPSEYLESLQNAPLKAQARPAPSQLCRTGPPGAEPSARGIDPLSWSPRDTRPTVTLLCDPTHSYRCISGSGPKGSSSGDRIISIRVGDNARMLEYYASAFHRLQQTNCRMLAKALIKVVEPNKQSIHPYNGGKGPDGRRRDPEETKPAWWPREVTHKEPDHLQKKGKTTWFLLWQDLTSFT